MSWEHASTAGNGRAVAASAALPDAVAAATSQLNWTDLQLGVLMQAQAGRENGETVYCEVVQGWDGSGCTVWCAGRELRLTTTDDNCLSAQQTGKCIGIAALAFVFMTRKAASKLSRMIPIPCSTQFVRVCSLHALR